MRWWNRLLGLPVDEERAKDEEALEDLRRSFRHVHRRTERLEEELVRVNAELRRKMQAR